MAVKPRPFIACETEDRHGEWPRTAQPQNTRRKQRFTLHEEMVRLRRGTRYTTPLSIGRRGEASDDVRSQRLGLPRRSSARDRRRRPPKEEEERTNDQTNEQKNEPTNKNERVPV
jgi:hypothetical protein